MLHWFKMLRYPSLSGIYLPFKIHHNCGIEIKQQARIKLGGRLTFGNPNKNSAIVSRLPINFFCGKRGTMEIGHSVTIGPGVTMIVKDDAQLLIGNNTYFTSDMHIEVVNTVQIGTNCAISWGVTIIDDHHHQLIPPSAHETIKKHVIIGDHVWIGCNVTVLEGTEIGNNSIIAAGSIVRGVFPDNALIAGNPAKVIKQGVNWK